MTINLIIHGDCFEVAKDYPLHFFDAIITDPPYQYLNHKLDAIFDEQSFIDMANNILKKDSMLAFSGRGKSFYKLNTIAIENGFNFKEEIIWDKRRTSSPMTPIGRKHETFSILGKGKSKINSVKVCVAKQKFYNDDVLGYMEEIKRFLSTFNKIKSLEDLEKFRNSFYGTVDKFKHSITWHSSFKEQKHCRSFGALKTITEGQKMPSIFRCVNDHFNYLHPTQKPVELMKQLILLTTKEGDTVLDPFCGSGTTLIACLKTNRNYVGIEKDNEYFEVANNRIFETTKQKELQLF